MEGPSLQTSPKANRFSDPRVLAGALALALIGVVIGSAFVGLLTEAGTDWRGALAAFDVTMLRIVRFTLLQATLSTLLSVLPAILVARALSRHPDFPGRAIILRLFAVPLALPAIVAALGVLALYGNAGVFGRLADAAGYEGWTGVYGLPGILVAHVFFNLPLATRLFLEALDAAPADHWRLSAQLGFRSRDNFRVIEWPALRKALPGAAGLVFMLCVTSFTIVLTLGGGPRATTLEVAIYQALRFDFDPARAVALTVLQLALTALILLLLSRTGVALTGDANLAISRRRYRNYGWRETLFDAFVILAAFAFVAGPMAATVAAGLSADLVRLAGEPSVIAATATSLALASLAATLSAALSFALVAARRALELRRRADKSGWLERLAGNGSGLVLIVPPIVIGAGWFILLRGSGLVFAVAPLMVVLVNAIMAMPFVMRAIQPAHDAASARHEKLCAQLGVSGWNRLRLVDWPVLRRPIFTGLAFAAALSLGDLGVIALFGSDAVQTLPYLLHSRMGSYRTADAAGLALLLGLLCFGLAYLADLLGKTPRHAA